MTILLYFILYFIVGAGSISSLQPLVHTPLGSIQGTPKTVQGVPVQVFLGIPYAEAPVGDLRFQKPKPVKPWRKTLNAINFSPGCTQYTIYPFPWYDDQPGKSEDCLHLNIYAPTNAKKGSDLAVLFWIHGGGFLFGSSRMDIHDASALALLGDVIVVTINYRLGVMGFLTSNTKDAPGNIGLWDIFTALQWVNNNIQSFGGDKSRITLFGESVGAMAISIFCVSPLTKGLFRRAIMESGSILVLTENKLQSNLNYSQQVAKIVGCASDSITIQTDPESVVGCLKNKNANYLAEALFSIDPETSIIFWPQYGDEVFPYNTYNDIRDGNFHDGDLFLSINRDEGAFLITTTDSNTFGFFGEKNTAINKTYADKVMGKYFSNYNDPQKVKDLGKVSDNDSNCIREQLYTAVGDVNVLCVQVYFAESYAQRNNVYFYWFDHRPSNTPWAPWMGTTHFEEVQFVFGRPIRKPEEYQLNEVELSERMIEYWSTFAKNGYPNLYWPKYSKENPNLLLIDTCSGSNISCTGPHIDNCNFLREHFGF